MGGKKFFSFLKERSREIIGAEELKRKLASRKHLRVKLGVDPTTPDLHLGHAVPLRVLKAFQDAGHQAVLIIGDFTGRIGDPSGKTTARRQLTAAEAKANERTYRAQVGRILDLGRTEVRHNSEWFSRMALDDFLELLTKFPLRGAWEREDFQTRLSRGKPVQLHEAMYHVLQAYDSVMVGADVELGAEDQRLNLLAGRELQGKLGRTPQDVVVLPYLMGLDGPEKMSKTAGNTINLGDAAPDMFGKIMAIGDALIVEYAELAAWLSPAVVGSLRRRLGARENPRDVKLDVAEAIVRLYHSANEARRAREGFLRTFSRRETPRGALTSAIRPGSYSGLQLVEALGGAPSRSSARRLLAGKAVVVDGSIIKDPHEKMVLRPGSTIRIGKKKFFRVR